MSVPIAILASGRGSNFDAIHSAIAGGKLDAEIKLVLSDQPKAQVLEKARKHGLKAVCVESEKGSSVVERRTAHEEKILRELESVTPRFLVLAGYMRIMTPRLIEAFRSEKGYARIVNVHPSLLPAFPGVSAYAQAFDHGAKMAGVTIHLVEADVDSGPICAQEAFDIRDCKSVEEVEKRGLAIEHRLFPETLKWVLPEKFRLEQCGDTGRYRVREN